MLDESPRFLMSKHNYSKAKDVLDKMATYNLRPSFKFNLQDEIDYFNNNTTKFKKSKNKNL